MLTIAAVKAAQPGARPYKLHDSGGLHLLVRPTGSKTFRLKFRIDGREQLLTIGSWPDVGLGEARTAHDRARELLDRNVDPRSASRPGVPAETFEQLARRWHAEQREHWSELHAHDVIASLERDVFPIIGARLPASIKAREIRDLLRTVENRGRKETARRLRERISGVFSLGIHDELCENDPAAVVARRLGPRPVQCPQPAITERARIRRLLADVDALAAPIVAKLASRFLALTAVRMASLRGGRWAEIEGVDGISLIPAELPQWRIPAARMKLTKVRKADPAAEHIVPLSRQAIAVLRALHLLTGGSELLFPGRRAGRPIGEGAIGELYDAAGYAGRHVPHGWRASFSTILNGHYAEIYGDERMRTLIDQCLAHATKSKVEGAYNRAKLVEQHAGVFQTWADLIDPDGRTCTQR